MLVITTTSGITTSWSWSEFLFDWKRHSLLHCGAKEDLSWNILFWFRRCGLEIIICIWTISPISAGSNTKYEELVHLSFTHKTLMKPRLHSRAVLGPLHPSVPSSHDIERICYCTHSTGVKLRRARLSYFPKTTEGSEQELHGLAALGSCTLPPCPASLDSQLLADLHFWRGLGFNLVSLIGIKYFWLWKWIVLTSGSCVA